MKKYTVKIYEVLRRDVEVLATSKKEAVKAVKADYEKEKIVLSADDYVWTEIK